MRIVATKTHTMIVANSKKKATASTASSSPHLYTWFCAIHYGCVHFACAVFFSLLLLLCSVLSCLFLLSLISVFFYSYGFCGVSMCVCVYHFKLFHYLIYFISQAVRSFSFLFSFPLSIRHESVCTHTHRVIFIFILFDRRLFSSSSSISCSFYCLWEAVLMILFFFLPLIFFFFVTYKHLWVKEWASNIT